MSHQEPSQLTHGGSKLSAEVFQLVSKLLNPQFLLLGGGFLLLLRQLLSMVYEQVWQLCLNQ